MERIGAVREWVPVIRDLAIILFSLVATFLGVLLYRKVASTLDSAKATMKNAQEMTSQLSEKVVKPVVDAVSLVREPWRVVKFISRFLRGKGERKDVE
ncbi:MAG: hypothetical protein HY672_03405 [Chloroflexi bacterium]|nr:hypothetical protein [Chloroflexota bacterium]